MVITLLYIPAEPLPPIFIIYPEIVTKLAEKQTAVLICRVLGAPKPKIVWSVKGQPSRDARFRTTEDGVSEISVS